MNRQRIHQKQQIIADMKFAIASETLAELPEQYLPASGWYQDFWLTIQPGLIKQLPAYVPVPSRLGLYFEWLWLKAIELHPNYQLIASNLQVQGAYRTLGSFDILVFNRLTGQTEHWELACKFYLAIPWQSNWLWLGPNLNDHWLEKKHKLLNHQIQLSQHQEAATCLKNMGIDTPEKMQLIVKGKVFYPKKLQGLNAGAVRANSFEWLTQTEWQLDNRNAFRQEKSCWLSTVGHEDMESKKTDRLEKPEMMLIEDQQRIVVPEQWPIDAESIAKTIT